MSLMYHHKLDNYTFMGFSLVNFLQEILLKNDIATLSKKSQQRKKHRNKTKMKMKNEIHFI